MKNSGKRWAVATAAALAFGGLVTPTGVADAEAAEGTETLSVDFSETTGTFRGGATGTLYGFGDHDAPTRALINGARITNSSQKAPYGTQHPSGDALKIESGFFDKHGEDLYIYIQDYYPDWAYNGGQRPGDSRTYNQADGSFTATPNGVWDYLEIVEFVTEAVATQSDRPQDYVFIPFNEADAGNWYADWGRWKDTFLGDWKATVDTIQAVYERNGLEPAIIGGPGDAAWRYDRTADYLDFSIANDVLPDIIIWHELGIDNLANFRSHLAEYRSLEAERGLDPLPINITEYGMLRDMGVPGQLIQWFSMFEDAKVDAQTAYWNYAGNFSDNSARANSANAGWWMFKWYGDLAGSETVRVTPPRLNAPDTLQGIGSVDTENRRATVLYGGTNADVTLDLSGLDTSVFGERVDVEVREATLSGAEGVTGTPRVIAALDGVELSDGSLELTVDTYDRYAGYQVVITPEQDRAVTADTVWTASIEAENADLTSATSYTQDPTSGGGWKFLASGGRDVGSFNRATSKADWTVEVPRDGTYRFQVIGSAPGVPGSHALFVDDTHATNVAYTADLALNNTSRWQYRGSAEVTVELTAGSHVLSLRASENGTSVLPNSDITLDKFVLTDVSDGEPTVYPASTLRYAGGAGVTYDADGARGFASLGADQRADVYAHAWDSGYYDVAIDYATTGAATVSVSVNGREITEVSAPEAGSWSSTARLHLAEGINEIELHSTGILLEKVVTTRAADSDALATTIEAEDATLAGAAAITRPNASAGSNASGGAYVGFIGNGEANTFTVDRQEAFSAPGDYDVVVHFANAETSGRHDYNPQVVDRLLTVTETGSPETASSKYFRYTYSWDSFWERTIPLTLTTTDGALVFGNTDGYAPNVDKVVIAPVIAGAPTTVSTIDHAPELTVAVSPEPVAGGWHTGPVTVSASATDERDESPVVEYRVGDGEWTASAEGVTIDAEGRTTVAVRATDAGGTSSPEQVVEVAIDTTAPVTTAAVDEAARTVTLTATDAGSGSVLTEYSLETGEAARAAATWVAYTEAITVGDEKTVVNFRSTDAVGNVEEAGSAVVAAVGEVVPTPGPTPGPTAEPTPSPAPAGTPGSGLASTGVNIGIGLGAALLLLIGGAGVVMFRRRRGGSITE
ncbi:hypothetical protein MN032_17510 [Agromyces atrinae]|uniref:OmpL47-type beta-barrel domain-containing protein n=1 Tax=Agromyces atrinae TaxID=592376 RepID=UPI001F5A0F1A|nr:hypothetical protein [Agromyces atrinae]MCI2959485.1 hypothetical protein [Agromyces atrinae]